MIAEREMVRINAKLKYGISSQLNRVEKILFFLIIEINRRGKDTT
jgi:cob(I)alamin adenosyltransferase